MSAVRKFNRLQKKAKPTAEDIKRTIEQHLKLLLDTKSFCEIRRLKMALCKLHIDLETQLRKERL